MMCDAPALALRVVTDGHLDVPLPGRGDTAERLRVLAGLCHRDISMGRLVEAHLDADAILADIIGERTGDGEFWGVWAAEPPEPTVTAERQAGRWELTGAKPWCSGVISCTHALVTARDADRRRLFAVDLQQPGVRPERGGWAATGMRTTETGTARFDRAVARPIGEPGAYLDRAGFFHGGIGVAACWLGGARKVADTLYATAARGRDDDITLMHLGAVDARLAEGQALLSHAAAAIDSAPEGLERARRLASQVRWSVEQIATDVIDRVNRALGPAPLVHHREHAQAVADLGVYIRQSHADRDLVTLGRLVVEESTARRPTAQEDRCR
ncbi:acyl-CoA dehydrogenase [Gordonia sp. HNM0687]|uniref:Acyl-CoA dehydrogenase n=1 Tax=Gordonia mangrovi TaxID=2665643 RepID=A0A6L7GSQ4_9ACTN|nr:acyl-CoA dehydrogenase family protein [Gordonia mangrovi]MDY6807814.1 acyl-CoA dehydrogenase family protein [Actinomycetota bacterium]MXP21558.1 acyl-CoA dehydrogenase [Gordonia mangrovi]UVF80301.1 acyl-CoA dehydrogenase family protein [Gordonia mangrovi]